MKKSSHRRRHALLAACALAGAAHAAPTYHLVDLGAGIQPLSLDDDDVVIGYRLPLTSGVWRDGTWRWDKPQGILSLNAAGDALIGPRADGKALGLQLHDGTKRALVAVGAAYFNGGGFLADDGSVLAMSLVDHPVTTGRQCVYWAPGQVKGTNVPLADRADCQPVAIDRAGRVVGSAQVAEYGNYQAFTWSGGAPQFIASASDPITFAWGVNGLGQIALSAGSAPLHAAYYDGTRIVDVGDPPGTSDSEMRGINDAGQMIGRAVPFGGPYRPYYFEKGQWTPLASLVDNLAGWTLASPAAINNRGAILAWANTADGISHTVLLRPNAN